MNENPFIDDIITTESILAKDAKRSNSRNNRMEKRITAFFGEDKPPINNNPFSRNRLSKCNILPQDSTLKTEVATGNLDIRNI